MAATRRRAGARRRAGGSRNRGARNRKAAGRRHGNRRWPPHCCPPTTPQPRDATLQVASPPHHYRLNTMWGLRRGTFASGSLGQPTRAARWTRRPTSYSPSPPPPPTFPVQPTESSATCAVTGCSCALPAATRSAHRSARSVRRPIVSAARKSIEASQSTGALRAFDGPLWDCCLMGLDGPR